MLMLKCNKIEITTSSKVCVCVCVSADTHTDINSSALRDRCLYMGDALFRMSIVGGYYILFTYFVV